MSRKPNILGAPLVGALLFALSAALPAAASEEGASMLAWGVAHGECAEWTDLCQVCARGAEGAPQCSTPGIACQPGPIACRKPSEAPAGSEK